MNRKVKNVSTLNYSQFGFKDFKMGKIMGLYRIHLGESRVRIINYMKTGLISGSSTWVLWTTETAT